MCGIFGCFIVLCNMLLVGDVLVYVILFGVVVVFLLVGYSVLVFFIGFVLVGLFIVVGIIWIQYWVNIKNDVVIGIVFIVMFFLGVIGIFYISCNQGVYFDLKDFFFGNVLGVVDIDLLFIVMVMVYVVISIIVFYCYLFVFIFQFVVVEIMGILV